MAYEKLTEQQMLDILLGAEKPTPEKLKSLKWDGIPRLHRLPPNVQRELHAEVARMMGSRRPRK